MAFYMLLLEPAADDDEQVGCENFHKCNVTFIND